MKNTDTDPCAPRNPCGSNAICTKDYSSCGFVCTPSKS